MSLTAALRPSSLSFNDPNAVRGNSEETRPFHHETSYLNLKRQLLRYQQLILLTPTPGAGPSSELTPLQRQIQAELWSPLPYHRTKWLRNIEGARNLLLQLERLAQNIKVQRSRHNAQKDLAEKRMIIKRLRNRVEEIGREVEVMGEEAWKLPPPDVEGETVWDMLQRDNAQKQEEEALRHSEDMLHDGKPVQRVEQDPQQDDQGRDKLFNKPSVIRRRGDQKADSYATDDRGLTSGYSGVDANERALLDSSRTQEDLTVSMISMAAQLKQQAKAFQFSLDQDKGLLDRALEGLDRNLSGMEAASKRMQFLKRMSESEGFFGRLKLYAMIFGMWVAAILLVFVGPKLRF
jgi:Membrane fusion protein Use1